MSKQQGPGGVESSPQDEVIGEEETFDEDNEQEVELEPVTDPEQETDPIPDEGSGE